MHLSVYQSCIGEGGGDQKFMILLLGQGCPSSPPYMFLLIRGYHTTVVLPIPDVVPYAMGTGQNKNLFKMVLQRGAMQQVPGVEYTE